MSKEEMITRRLRLKTLRGGRGKKASKKSARRPAATKKKAAPKHVAKNPGAGKSKKGKKATATKKGAKKGAKKGTKGKKGTKKGKKGTKKGKKGKKGKKVKKVTKKKKKDKSSGTSGSTSINLGLGALGAAAPQGATPSGPPPGPDNPSPNKSDNQSGQSANGASANSGTPAEPAAAPDPADYGQMPPPANEAACNNLAAFKLATCKADLNKDAFENDIVKGFYTNPGKDYIDENKDALFDFFKGVMDKLSECTAAGEKEVTDACGSAAAAGGYRTHKKKRRPLLKTRRGIKRSAK